MRSTAVLLSTAFSSSALALSSENHSSRRNFLQKFTVASSAFALGGSLNLELHDADDYGCTCQACRRNFSFGVRDARAYEKRNVGGDNPSAATYAMNEQALKTNNRLEAQGYKLQTEAEQTAEAKSFLSSYSYNADVSSGNSKSTDKRGAKSKK